MPNGLLAPLQPIQSSGLLSGGPSLEQSLNLTEQERNIVNYHRNTISSGNVGRDEQGRPVSVYSTGIIVPRGPNAGKFVSVPGYVDGQVRRRPDGTVDEDWLFNRWEQEINEGKWPFYDSGESLNKRSQEIHGIMDREAPE